MKRFWRIFTALFLAVTVVLGAGVPVNAQNIGAVVYDFGGYTVPSGMSQQFPVNSVTLVGMLAKNADGSYALDAAGNFYADDNRVGAFVSALAALYDLPGVNTLNQSVERQYLKAIIASGASDPSHKPSMNVVQAPVTNLSGTYILVDISDQKLYYFVNSTLTLTSDVV